MALGVPPAGADQVARDPSYDADGVVQLDFARDADIAEAMALQPDGKVVLTGRSMIEGDFDMAVARFNVDGSLDATFGDGGLVVVHLGGHEVAYAVAVQPDGRIVVGGSWGGWQLLIRLDPFGNPDPSFGEEGLLTPAEGTVQDLLVQPDGRIVTTATVVSASRAGDISVARYLANGDTDPSFGSAGRTDIDAGSVQGLRQYETAVALARLDDGGYAIVGRTAAESAQNTNTIAVRLTAAGLPDTGFNGSGYRIFDFGPSELGVDVLADSAGRMVIGAHVYSGSVAMARLLPNGGLDPSFGVGGVVREGPILDAMARDQTGRILVASFGAAYQLSRYTATGAPEPLNGGQYRSDLTRDNEFPTDLAVLPDGRIVVAGYVYASLTLTSTGQYDADWFVERLLLGPDPAPAPAPAPVPPPPSPAGTRSGYWLLGTTGRIYAFGDALHRGSYEVAATNLTSTPSGNGYWVVSASGGVFTSGDAPYLGGTPVLGPGERVTSISATPSGAGYWLFTSNGRVHPYGDARQLGDLRGSRLNGAVLGSVATPTGRGYYMVAADGGVFAFGDAAFKGSMGGQPLNGKVVGLAPDPDGDGYWLVAEDGGVFAFNAPFKGSMGGQRMNKPMVGLVAFGDGYLGVASDGGVFNFSARPFSGSLGATPPAEPIVAVAPLKAP